MMLSIALKLRAVINGKAFSRQQILMLDKKTPTLIHWVGFSLANNMHNAIEFAARVFT